MRLVPVLVAVAGVIVAPCVHAQSFAPTPRSSAAGGIVVQPEAVRSGAASAPVRAPAAASAPNHPQDAAPVTAGPPQPTGGDGATHITGSTTTNATSSQTQATSVGGGNSGCNNIGTISGRGC